MVKLLLSMLLIALLFAWYDLKRKNYRDTDTDGHRNHN
jgi:hypothetical protein